MRYNETMFNRQLGRNAQLFAHAIGRMETPEERYPYIRELLAVIEEARPEWAEAAHKAPLYAHLVRELCGPLVTDEEIEAAVRTRDAERALAALPDLEWAPAPDAPAAEPEPAAPAAQGHAARLTPTRPQISRSRECGRDWP